MIFHSYVGWAPHLTKPRGDECKRGHLLTPENVKIQGAYRRCRTCMRENDVKWLAKKRAISPRVRAG